MDADSGRTLEHWVYKKKMNGTRETAAHKRSLKGCYSKMNTIAHARFAL